jgi:hypothetical protein
MNQVVSNYAPVRFLPYRDVGEFINVGVVVHCPPTDFFGYRLVPQKRTARVTGFFPELEAKFFKAAMQGLARELRRVQSAHRPLPAKEQVAPQMAKEQMRRFLEVVRRREGLLHFGDVGTLMANTPEEALEALFGRFVERQFAHKREYQEIIMRNRLADFLRDWKLVQHYEMNKPVGDVDFHVVMPFVHYDEGVPAKVIKPLDLNKVETSEIYLHGGAWVKNIERLKNRKHLPPAVVFTVRFPDTGKRMMAAQEICNEFRQLGVEPVEFDSPSQLRSAVELPIAA